MHREKLRRVVHFIIEIKNRVRPDGRSPWRLICTDIDTWHVGKWQRFTQYENRVTCKNCLKKLAGDLT